LTNFEQVREFHQVFKLLDNDKPTVPALSSVVLRKKLINEEYKELMAEIDPYIDSSGTEPVNLVNVAKELSDLLYVCYGMAVDFGIDIDKVFEEVHSSNMSKLDENGKPVYNSLGKVIKSNLYRPADVNKILGTNTNVD
jgi:predicted HAD superfamily Cof-like phosphohydrolase